LERENQARSSGLDEEASRLRALVERKTRMVHRLKQLPSGSYFPLEVLLLQMGDAVWVGVQGEAYSLLQTELRRRFPAKAVVVASIGADWGASYLPPRRVYGTGIYQDQIAAVAGGSLEQLIDSISNRVQ
jgi:hypothetical protein